LAMVSKENVLSNNIPLLSDIVQYRIIIGYRH